MVLLVVIGVVGDVGVGPHYLVAVFCGGLDICIVHTRMRW